MTPIPQETDDELLFVSGAAMSRLSESLPRRQGSPLPVRPHMSNSVPVAEDVTQEVFPRSSPRG